MRLAALYLIFCCGPAFGQVAVVSCNGSGGAGLSQFDRLLCFFRNDGETPVASISYTVALRGEGRTVPWNEFESEQVAIPGGIEPGETRLIFLDGEYLPLGASRSQIIVDVEVTAAFDVSGQLIQHIP